jgi:hypothetical protein
MDSTRPAAPHRGRAQSVGPRARHRRACSGGRGGTQRLLGKGGRGMGGRGVERGQWGARAQSMGTAHRRGSWRIGEPDEAIPWAVAWVGTSSTEWCGRVPARPEPPPYPWCNLRARCGACRSPRRGGLFARGSARTGRHGIFPSSQHTPRTVGVEHVCPKRDPGWRVWRGGGADIAGMLCVSGWRLARLFRWCWCWCIFRLRFVTARR